MKVRKCFKEIQTSNVPAGTSVYVQYLKIHYESSTQCDAQEMPTSAIWENIPKY